MRVLVTGAAGGIGHAIYNALAERGDDVLGQDIAAHPHIHRELVGDLCNESFLDAVERLVASGGLDAVVAAHGISGGGRLNEITPERSRMIMEINFESVVKLWDRVGPLLTASGGTFAVIVSQAGLVGEAGNALYCASKFALTGWLRGLEKQTSVRLRAINPGGIKTPLLETALKDMAAAQGITYDELVAKRYGHSPAGRIADPHELGDLLKTALDFNTPSLVEIAITGGEVLW